MKPISIDTKRAVALAAVLFSAACIVSVAEDLIPLIRMVDVPLSDAIKTLARQSNLNYILDPHVPGSDFGPGRLAPKLLVTANWTNVTAQAALSALLKEHSLTMVSNTATSNEQGYADRAWVRWTSDKKTMFSGSYGYNGYLYSDGKFSEPGDPKQQQLFTSESAIQKPALTPVFFDENWVDVWPEET